MAVNRTAVAPAKLAPIYAQFRCSPAVRAGNLLFVSGQIGDFGADMTVTSDLEGQCVEAFESIGAILAEAGATFADVVEIVTYHARPQDIPVFLEVKNRYLVDEPYPAWTGIGAELLTPGALVEVRCTAVLDR